MPQLLAKRDIRPSQQSGYANSAADSVYPDLFNSLIHATVPAIGSLCRFEDYSGRNRPTGTFPVMVRFGGEWSHNHPAAGNRTTIGLMDDVVPLSNTTIICGYKKTDATQRNGGIFGNSNITASNYANLTSKWSDTKTYWQWGTTFINDIDEGFGELIYGNDNHFAGVASSARGMELWYNGAIAAWDTAATHSRTAGSGFLQLGHHNANGSDVVAYRYLMVFDRALTHCELEMLGHNPYAMFEPKRTHNFLAAAITEHTKSESHTLGVTDEETHTVDHNRTEADDVGISDTVVLAGDWARTESDDIGITDSVIVIGNYSRSLSDTLGITDLGEGSVGTIFPETVTDPITFVSTGSGSALNLDNLFVVVVDGKLQRQPVGNLLRARGDLNMSSYEIYADNQVYQRVKRLAVSTDTTLVDETWVLADATAGNVTLTLPPATDFVDRRVEITKSDVTGNSVIIDADGSETISGATTQTLTAQYENVTIISDGTEWWIL
jgi:hypothetical protein